MIICDECRCPLDLHDADCLTAIAQEAIPCTCLGDTFDPACRYHAWEATRALSSMFRPGFYPADMTTKERHARRLMASAMTAGAIAHYMGVYAGSAMGGGV